MIACPLRGIHWRDKISQKYGENEDWYTERFGKYGITKHTGTDYATPVDTPIHAPFDGRISFAGEDGSGYGLCIFIWGNTRFDNSNLECVLAHLSKLSVREGDIVKMGDEIGRTGNTGLSTGPHLHFGVRARENDEIKDFSNGARGYYAIEEWTMYWE